MTELAASALSAAREAGLRIVTAESCTGGLVAAALTDIPGSSDVVDRGCVTYSNAAKVEMLGVQPVTLSTHGAVSEEVAREMALGAAALCPGSIAVSVTGIAGPRGSEFKPEGRVCFGLVQGEIIHTETQDFGPLGRCEVRAASVTRALELLLSTLQHRQQ